MSTLLEVQGVHVHHDAHRALDGVSVAASRGEIVGIIGPDGAGKTTLMDVIAGEVPPSAGRVLWEGDDITTQPAWRRARSGIARTFQAVDLVTALTVRENLMLGCQARQRTSLLEDGLRVGRSRRAEVLAGREVDRVTDLVGLSGDAGRTVSELPLGRRRIVEIGRALCAGPSLLLLDEAGSGMSGEDLDRLAGLLRRLTRDEGLAVMLVEHDVEFVFGVSDFVYVLSAGRLISRGMPAAVRDHPDVVAAYTGEVAREPVAASA